MCTVDADRGREPGMPVLSRRQKRGRMTRSPPLSRAVKDDHQIPAATWSPTGIKRYPSCGYLDILRTGLPENQVHLMSSEAKTPSIGFVSDIRPLFRDRDIVAMKSFGLFDLSDYDDVVQNYTSILLRLEQGDMPCDGRWPPHQVELFRMWGQSNFPL